MSAVCSYVDHNDHPGIANAVGCRGPVAFMSHDKRGCRLVCEAHALWMKKQSQMFGHSPDCPWRLSQWERITPIRPLTSDQVAELQRRMRGKFVSHSEVAKRYVGRKA